MSRERELLERVLTSELWSLQEELQSEIRELLAEPEKPEQKPVATKLASHQFTAFHVSSSYFKELQKLAIGTKLYTSPQSVKLRSYAQAEEDLKRLEKRCPLRCDFSQAMKDLKRESLSEGELNSLYYQATNQTLREQDTRLAFGFARAIEKAHGITGGKE